MKYLMVKSALYFSIAVAVCGAMLFSFTCPRGLRQANHAPVVRLLEPHGGSSYAPGARIPYRISVSDKEDGESKYQEIDAREVFLEVRPAGEPAKTGPPSGDSAGLALIKHSNCMNCHTFRDKLIGPPFYDIIRRYRTIPGATDSLASHLLSGSKGRWGNVQMPSNSGLTGAEARKIISWLFNNAADSTVQYLAGTAGSFRLYPGGARAVLLEATYTDHGTKEQPLDRLTGKDTVVIGVR